MFETKESDGYLWGYTNYMGMCGWFVTDFAELISSSKDDPTIPTEPETQPTQPVEGVMGDADLDGEVSVIDATQIQLYLASIITPTTQQRALSDVDCDGHLSIMDSTKILLQLAGID